MKNPKDEGHTIIGILDLHEDRDSELRDFLQDLEYDGPIDRCNCCGSLSMALPLCHCVYIVTWCKAKYLRVHSVAHEQTPPHLLQFIERDENVFFDGRGEGEADEALYFPGALAAIVRHEAFLASVRPSHS